MEATAALMEQLKKHGITAKELTGENFIAGDTVPISADALKNALKLEIRAVVAEAASQWRSKSFHDFESLEWFYGVVATAAEYGSTAMCLVALRCIRSLERKHFWKGAVVLAIEAAAAQAQTRVYSRIFKHVKKPDGLTTKGDCRDVATEALLIGCRQNQGTLVDLALKDRADPTQPSKDLGKSAAHIAAEGGHEALLRKLFEGTPNSNQHRLVDAGGRTPLHLAAHAGREEVCEYLLKIGADPNAADNTQLTSLHLAAMHGSTDICKKLIKNGAVADPRGSGDVTPTLLAAASGDIECIRDALLENGCVLASEFDTGFTAYDELLRTLNKTTKRLNEFDNYTRATLWLVPLAVLYTMAVATTVVITSFEGDLWWVPAVLCAAFAGLMTLCRHKQPPDDDARVFLDLLRAARSTLQSCEASPRRWDATSVETLLKKLTDYNEAPADDSLRLTLAEEVKTEVSSFLTAQLNRLPETPAADRTLQSAREAIDTISFIIENRFSDRVRLLTVRNALHSVLTKGETNPETVLLDSPFKDPVALMKARWDRVGLLICSTIVMVTIFVTLAVIMFTAEGAVAYGGGPYIR
jgi:ankyrin repeat protein